MTARSWKFYAAIALLLAATPTSGWGQSGSRRAPVARRRPPTLTDEQRDATPMPPATPEERRGSAEKANTAAPSTDLSAPATKDSKMPAQETSTTAPSDGQRPTQQEASVKRPTLAQLPVPLSPLPRVALDGFDPVSLMEGTLKKGSPSITSERFGQVYHFVTEEAKKQFDSAKAQFTPVLAGESVVALKDEKRIVAGLPSISSVYGRRFFLFANVKEKETFDDDPERYEDVDLILNGISSVSLVDQEAASMGHKVFQILFNGRRVRLVNAEEVLKFQANPGKYFPSLNGLDPVALVEGRALPGSPTYCVVYKNRLFAFQNPENRTRFLRSPETYADLDVANGGICPVTQTEKNQSVTGHYGISTIYRGRRYLFVSDSARKEFAKDPEKYLGG